MAPVPKKKHTRGRSGRRRTVKVKRRAKKLLARALTSLDKSKKSSS